MANREACREEDFTRNGRFGSRLEIVICAAILLPTIYKQHPSYYSTKPNMSTLMGGTSSLASASSS